MDAAMLLVGLLVVGVPAAVFLTLRRRGGPQPAGRPERRDAAPPGDFGMARESGESTQGRETTEAADGAAAAAAAGGALILAVGAARGHAADHSGDTPETDGDGADGGAK